MARAREIEGLAPEDTFAAAAARIVAVRAQELFDHAEGVLDTADVERVHDMRVASRRLRAVLEVFAPCFPRKRHRRVLADVERLADALGARRDPDVQIVALERLAEALGEAERPGIEVLLARRRAEQAAGNEALAAALAEAERSDLRNRLAALAAEAGTR